MKNTTAAFSVLKKCGAVTSLVKLCMMVVTRTQLPQTTSLSKLFIISNIYKAKAASVESQEAAQTTRFFFLNAKIGAGYETLKKERRISSVCLKDPETENTI